MLCAVPSSTSIVESELYQHDIRCCTLYFRSQIYGMESPIDTMTTNSVGHAHEPIKRGSLMLSQ